jgi:hypothetical protein
LPRTFAAIRPWFYLLVLAWINVYIGRETFYTEATGHYNSMQGEWLALARLADFSWWHASWWPWWGGGAPLEYTYAPLVPMLTSFIAWVSHHSPSLSFNQLAGAVYCGTPVLLYVVSWLISGHAGYSFAAGTAASLLSPFELIVPDDRFRWSSWLDQRRMMLSFDWDEVPHLITIALLPVALWFLWRALESRRARDFAASAVCMALMMLSNAFGMVLIAFTVVMLPFAMDKPPRLANLLRCAATAFCAWILVSPWLPPSLILQIHAMSVLDHEAAPTSASVIALSAVTLGCAAVYFASRHRIANWGMRWLLMFSCAVLLIPILDHYAKVRFLPQPGRYKIEADIVLPWLAVFAVKPLAERIPWRSRLLLAIPLLWLAANQVIFFRRDARVRRLRPVDVTQSLEYKLAKWTEENLPGERVMMPGSTGQWATAFANVVQMGAQAYTTSPNSSQYIAHYVIPAGDGGDRAAAIAILWLKAFATRAIVVPGPRSPEYWHPFHNPREFDGVLPVVWHESDTTVYRVFSGPYSLAHVLHAGDLVRHTPVNGVDVAELGKYVAALEDPSAPPATLVWHGYNSASINARMEPDQLISAQINWDPGWHARVNGVARPMRRDGIGLSVVETNCAGECRIDLEYDGGTERRLCRIASAGMPALFLIMVGVRRRRRSRL